jgi:hypothetical protein
MRYCMARFPPYCPPSICRPLLIANVLRTTTYLCWQMGMGKTFQGAGALRCILEATSPDTPCHCLVVAPRSTLPDWESALIKAGASVYVESACLVGLVFPGDIFTFVFIVDASLYPHPASHLTCMRLSRVRTASITRPIQTREASLRR